MTFNGHLTLFFAPVCLELIDRIAGSSRAWYSELDCTLKLVVNVGEL